jgi:hypothetical protein
MTDWTKWKMVPVEAIRAMLEAAHFGPNCAEEGLSANDEQFWIDVWNAMLASAPPPPVVEVTDELAEKVAHTATMTMHADTTFPKIGRDMISAVQSILGPTLGMISRDEHAAAVEAAYREAQEIDGSLSDEHWLRSDARKRLESWR